MEDDDEYEGPTQAEIEAEAEQNLALRELMNQHAFRAFLWRTLERCALYQDGFSESHAGASFISGKRSVGLSVLKEVLKADPLAYVKLQQENHDATRS